MQNITMLLDVKCATCEFKNKGYGRSSNNYCKDDCSVFNDINFLSSKLIGDEKPKKSKQIKHDEGLKTGRWDQDDEFYLIHHAGLFSINHLAVKLSRTPKDVYNKIWRLKVSKKIKV
jgi:hypothetical protein